MDHVSGIRNDKWYNRKDTYRKWVKPGNPKDGKSHNYSVELKPNAKGYMKI